MRHGQADWPDWSSDDDERPLTEKGEKEVRRVAKFLSSLGIEPQTIFTSPLPRAAQTAKLAHKAVGGELLIEKSLSPGATARAVRALLKKQEGDILIVGHEPDFSTIITSLTGARVKMSKAGVACIGLDEQGKGRLLWLAPPKITAR